MALEKSVSVSRGHSKFNAAIIGCVLAIAASVATWGILHAKHRFYSVDSNFDIGLGASNQARLALDAETARVDRLNAAISLAIGGGLLAIALAVLANACCSLPLRIVAAIPWGIVCGAGTGFLGPLLFAVLIPGDKLHSATKAGIAQAVVFACLGLGIGLLYGAFSRSSKTLATAAIFGAIAGGIGGIAFPIVASMTMPSQNTGTFISDVSMVRLLWLSIPFMFIGFAIPSMSSQAAKQSSAESKPAQEITSNLGATS